MGFSQRSELEIDEICVAQSYQISGARILPLGSQQGVTEGHDLWLADGRIAAVLPRGSKPPINESYEILTFENAVVLPGLVNAHSHSASCLQRGQVAGAPLDLFVMEAMSRRSTRTIHHVRTAALLHAVEMLKRGITGVVDHFRHGAVPTAEAVTAAMGAYEEIGMRAIVAPMYEDRPYIESMPIDTGRLPKAIIERWRRLKPPAFGEYFSMMEEAVSEARRFSRVSIMLGIDGPQRCTPALLEKGGSFAAQHGVGLHTHLLEAKTQSLVAPVEYGRSFVDYLDRFGLVGPHSSLAHFVWCTDRDIELAAERGVNVINNPVSNLALGSGIQPTARLLARGVRVALGTDGASSNAINLLEQAKISMLLSRVAEQDCGRWITAPQAIRMATEGGARVLGLEGKTGVIEPGALADIAILDLNNASHRPFGNVWNHLVMYETGQSVDTVFVGGEMVVKGGRCLKVDETAIYAEAALLATEDAAKNSDELTATRAERSAFEPLLTECLSSEWDINRFARLT